MINSKIHLIFISASLILFGCKKKKDDNNAEMSPIEILSVSGPIVPEFKSIFFTDSIQILKTHFVDDKNLFFIAKSNKNLLQKYIIKSNNGGQTFEIKKFKFPYTFNYNTIILDSSRFIAYGDVGDSSIIIYNTSGEISEVISKPSPTSQFFDIASLNSNEIAISFYNDGVYKYNINSKIFSKIANGFYSKIFSLNNVLVIGGSNNLGVNNIRIYKNYNDTSNYKTIPITNYSAFSYGLITPNYVYILARTVSTLNTSFPAVYKFDLAALKSESVAINKSNFVSPPQFMMSVNDNTIYYGSDKTYKSIDGLLNVYSYDILKKGLTGTRTENGAVFKNGAVQYFYIIEVNGYRIMKNI